MKKIRILALIMAVLMLPVAMLFGCNKTPSEDPGQEPTDPGGITIPVTPDAPFVPDNDGTKEGYHLFYNFNDADLGNLPTVEPYKEYLTAVEKTGGSYMIKDRKDAEGEKALVLYRTEGSISDPYLEIGLKTVTELNAQHMVEFDIRWEPGLINGKVTFYARKDGPVTTPFLEIDANGLYDGGGFEIYGKDDKAGWLHIQVAIDDINRVYDLYIDGVKKTSKSPYVNTNYSGWDVEQASTYRISMSSSDNVENMVWIDNLGVKNQSIDDVAYDSVDITYTDAYTEATPFLTATFDGAKDFLKRINKTVNKDIPIFSYVAIDEAGAVTDLTPDWDAAVADGAAAPVVPEGSTPALKIANFVTSAEMIWKPDILLEGGGFNPELYTTVRFKFYAPEKLIKDNYVFMVLFDTANSSEGWSYWSHTFAAGSGGQHKIVEGWNDITFNITSGGSASRQPSMDRLYQIRFIFSGWSNGVNKVAADGYEFYVSNFEFSNGRTVKVEGPDMDHLDCTHVDSDGNSYLVPVESKVEASCTAGSYFVKECSVCGATKIDQDKEFGLPLGHSYGEEKTVNATCGTSGKVYQNCTVCGAEKIVRTIPTLSHNVITEYNWNDRVKTEICTICGEKKDIQIITDILPYEEKLAVLGDALHKKFYVTETHNNTILFDKTDISSASSSFDNIFCNAKYAIFQSKESDSGLWGFEHIRANSAHSSDSYFDLRYQDEFGVGAAVVTEFEIMLGNKSTDNKYPQLDIQHKDRNSFKSDWKYGAVDTSGKFTLNADSTYSIKLSNTEYTHFAFCLRPAENKFDVYVNYELVREGLTMSSNADIAKFLITELRFTYKSGASGEYQGSYFFNNILAYEGTAPLCVLSGDDSVVETTGDIALEGIQSSFNVSNAAVKGTLPVGCFTSKYVLSMDVAASGTLNDGALISAVKVVNGFDEKLALVEVKGGKLYSQGIMIADSTNVKLDIICNDQHDTVKILVNGTEVLSEIRYADEDYCVATQYVNAFVFEPVGSYSVSNFAFYTGTAAK